MNLHLFCIKLELLMIRLFIVCVLWAGFATAQEIPTAKEKFKFKYLFKSYAHPWLSNTSVNVGVGFSAYTGELGRIDDFSKQNFHLNQNIRLGIQHRFTDYLSWRFEGGYYKLHATDGGAQPKQFSSHNFDYFGALVIDTKPRPDLDARFKRWNVYFFGGIGQTHFKPFDPDSKEDITTVKKKFAVIFPVGMGIMYFKNDFISLGVEVNRVFTLTDYLDGEIVPNTYPKNDGYFLYGFKMNLNIFNRFRYSNYLRRRRG